MASPLVQKKVSGEATTRGGAAPTEVSSRGLLRSVVRPLAQVCWLAALTYLA